MKNKNKAFTLIELLVVIAIIAILTAIVMTNLFTAKSKSRDAKRVSDLAQINLALELFFDRCNRYPVVDSTTNMPLRNDASNGCPTGITLETFISKIPTAPTPGSAYSYGVNNDTKPLDYVLKAVLENNNNVLVDSPTTDFSASTIPDINCSTPQYSYCLQPR